MLSPPPHKYLHQKTHKFTLKLTKVRMVEMVEIFSDVSSKDILEALGDELCIN